MGGLVGGFYATGATPADLEKIALEADWSDLSNPTPRFLNQPVVEKRYWSKPNGDLTLRFGHHFSLPTGINSGESLALMFSRQTAAYANLETFDRLPIPFRCVATDLVSANAIVLDRGSLPKALRATMALPGIFTPVEWGDKVLIDGGLVENLPVEPAREMGADVVIAVLLEGEHASVVQLRSLGTVLRQTISIPVLQNERRSASLANLVIRVQTGTFSGTDFEGAAKLIQKGYEAAQANAVELASFALSPEEWEAYLVARQQRIRHLPSESPLVSVISPQPSIQHAAQHEAYRELGASSIPPQRLEYVLAGMTAATGLPGAYYGWQNEVAKPKGYRVEFLPRPGAVVLLRPGVFFQLSSDEPSLAAFRLGGTGIPSATYKSRYIGEINAGYDPGIRAEYYRPFGGTPYFVGPGIFIQRYNEFVYAGPARTDFQRVRAAGSFYAGIGAGRFGQFSVGIQAGYDSYSQPVTTNGVTAHSTGFANPEAAWLYNTQDSGGLPTHGTLLEGSLGYSFRNTPFPYLQNHFSAFHPVHDRVSLFVASDQDSSFGKNLSFYDQFTYGGARELDAYRYQEFRANTLVSAGGGAFFHVFKVRRWSLNPSFAAWYEAARLDLGSQGWQTRQSTSLGTFVPSPVGVVGLTLSFAEDGKARFRFSLGSF